MAKDNDRQQLARLVRVAKKPRAAAPQKKGPVQLESGSVTMPEGVTLRPATALQSWTFKLPPEVTIRPLAKETKPDALGLFEPIPALVDLAARTRLRPTLIERRLITAAAGDDRLDVLYQHSALCQTYFPYRDPGDDVREHERVNGDVHLKVLAGEAMHPQRRELVPVGLPFGPKCRLVLMHLNQRVLAKKEPDPVIDLGDSLTLFVKDVLKLDPKGRNIRSVKDQLVRLAASAIRLGVVRDGHAVTINTHIISAFELWCPRDARQRVLLPTTIRFADAYLADLLEHGVPQKREHIAALSHNTMGLDIYTWLSQRLHRIPPTQPAFVPWTALYNQFGQGYDRRQIEHFRAAFRVALKQVLALYKTARVTDEDARRRLQPVRVSDAPAWRSQAATGLTLRQSPPVVPYRYVKE